MRNRIVSGFVCVTALGLLLICSIPAHAVPFSVSIGQNFTGSTFRVDSGFIPPDSNGAVGPSHFVELINGRYSVYQKSDGVRVQTSTLNQFWSDASLPPQVNRGAFDPRIVFDHASKRWFASSGQRTSNVLLGVSKSSDPTAGWTGFSIDLPVKGVF
jgi:hypothetical protein